MGLSSLFGGGGSTSRQSSNSSSTSSANNFTDDFNLQNALFNAGLSGSNMFAGASGGLANLQNQQLGNAGLFGGMATNNQGADLASMLGQGLLGGASQFGPQGQFQGGPSFQGASPFQYSGFDPNQLAQSQYNLGKSIISPDQQQAQLDMEQRLFSQGRLGSTGGGHDQNALFDAQNTQDQNLLLASLDQGLQAQNQLFNQGLMAQGQNFNQGLAGYNANQNNLFNTRQQQNADFGQQFGAGAQALALDPTLRGLFQNMSSSELANLLNIQNTGTNLFNSGAGAFRQSNANSQSQSSSRGSTRGGGSDIGFGDLFGAGLVNAGVAGLTGGIGNLFPAAAGAAGAANPFLGGTSQLLMPPGGTYNGSAAWGI